MTQREVLSLSRAQVGYVSGGFSLAQLGVTIQPGVRYVTVKNVGSKTIYMGVGSAASTGYTLAASAEDTMRVTASGAADLRFMCVAGEASNMNVKQEGPDTV